MAPTEPCNIKFSPTDSERLATLTKEVQARLQEMAMIATKAKGVPLDDSVKIRFAPHQAEAFFTGMHIEIFVLDGQTCCVVWDNFPDSPAYLLCPCA